jgi:uncharacterized protein with FMN-binding domain
MRRSFFGRAVPTALSVVGAAIPATTAALVMLHAMNPRSAARGALPVSPSGPSVAAVVTPTPRPAASTRSKVVSVAARSIAGPVVDDRYGQVQATITVKGSRITNVSITAPENDPRSATINVQAVPLLRTETLQAQSANVDLISGATITSEAYVQSLRGALQTIGL